MFTKTSQEIVLREVLSMCVHSINDVVLQKEYINNSTGTNIFRDHSLWSCFVFKETLNQIKFMYKFM